MPEDIDYERMKTELEQMSPIHLHLEPEQALQLVSVIQLASRHPRASKMQLMKVALALAHAIASQFQGESRRLLELGFNPQHDVPFDNPNQRTP